jgi:hypothetical protein
MVCSKGGVFQREANMMEFHISSATRSRYQVDDVLFSYTGNVVFADLAASRALANGINDDPSTGKVYLAAADFGPRPAPAPANPHPRTTIRPGNFTVLVVGK